MGIYTHWWRPGKIVEATAIGVVLLLAALVFGRPLAHSAYGQYFTLGKNSITLAMVIYGFTASVLPVWLLLCPRFDLGLTGGASRDCLMPSSISANAFRCCGAIVMAASAL
jgi:carbon starvation protein CstA